MRIINIIISKIAIIFMCLFSIILIVLPFNFIDISSITIMTRYASDIENNYIYSIIGGIYLLLNMVALFSGIRIKPKKPKQVVTPMNFGDLIISEEAIKGLTYNVISKNIGLRDPKILVTFNELGIGIFIKGQVSPDINIPEAMRNIQLQVKESIQNSTGLEVENVSIEIVAISTPIKTLK